MTHRSFIGAAAAFIAYEAALIGGAFLARNPVVSTGLLIMAVPIGTDTVAVTTAGGLLTSGWGHSSGKKRELVMLSSPGGPSPGPPSFRKYT